MGKRILVTGGAGFLGAHLCEKLIERGHRVVCLDNFSTGQMERLKRVAGHPHFSLIRQDVCEPLALEIEEIYNLASPASPLHYQKDPIATLKTNVIGTLRLLELASLQNAKLLQASTSEVYGDPEHHPQSESYWGYVNPIGIRSCYDEGKRCAETLCMDFHRQQGVKVAIARIFNTYGPRMDVDDGRVVSNFIVQALQGKPLTLFGTGSQTRSFCFVDDLIEGLILLMERGQERVEPVNLGNPEEYTILQLAELVRALTGSTAEIVQHPLPEDDPKRRRPNIEKAERELQWRPRTSLREGLEKTIAFFRESLAHSMPI